MKFQSQILEILAPYAIIINYIAVIQKMKHFFEI